MSVNAIAAPVPDGHQRTDADYGLFLMSLSLLRLGNGAAFPLNRKTPTRVGNRTP
jgi:hypothetical protein